MEKIKRLKWEYVGGVRMYYWVELEGGLVCENEGCRSDVNVFDGLDYNGGDVEMCGECKRSMEMSFWREFGSVDIGVEWENVEENRKNRDLWLWNGNMLGKEVM